MADNYIEKRMESLREAPRREAPAPCMNLETLLSRSLAGRSFDSAYPVHQRQLQAIASVAEKILSQQEGGQICFRCVFLDEADKVRSLIACHVNAQRLQIHPSALEAGAFIVMCSSRQDTPDNGFLDGMLAQTMLLKAAQMGLNGVVVRDLPEDDLSCALSLGTDASGLRYRATTLIAIGKANQHG